MNVYILLPLVSAILIFVLGIAVFDLDKTGRVNRLFLLLCITASFWAFSEFMLRQAESPGTALFWMRLTSFWVFAPPLLFQFIVVFTGNEKPGRRWWLLPLIYVPAAVFWATEFFTGLILTVPVQEPWGYTYGYAADLLPFYAEMAWVVCLAIIALALCVQFYLRATKKQQRFQVLFIAVGTAIPVCGGVISQVILPLYQFELPETATVFFLFFSILVAYAISTYGLFVITPGTTAEAIVSTTPEALVLLDSEEKVRVTNAAAQEMLGRDRNLIGSPVESIFPSTAEKERVFARIVTAGRVADLETELTGAGTAPVPVSLSASVIRDRDGALAGIVCVARDIRTRKAIEAELRESETKYRTLAENTADVLFTMDLQGRFTYVSPRVNKYGYLEEEVLSRPFLDFVYPADRKRVAQNFREIINGASRENDTFRVLNRWGYVHWVEQHSMLRVDVHGRPVGLYGVVMDVTDRRRAEEGVILANRKLNLLNNITRHDILNTITGLLGLVDMAAATENLEERNGLNALIRDRVQVIQRQINFTREYQEVGVHAPQWQGFHAIMEKVTGIFSRPGVSFVVDPEDIEVYADPLFEKVFYNLIDNALRYGDTVTTIRFYCEISDRGLELVCEDNGVGIPAGEKEHIFERGIGKNTGMGLFLTREILGITGIMIAENGTLGKGARFVLSIPNGAWRFPGADHRDAPGN